MGDFCVYGHFAKQDFTDNEGNFHAVGTCCYIGSGNKNRPFTLSTSSRRSVHLESKDFLEIRVLEDSVEDVDKVTIEQKFYDYYINEGCKLFNKHRPRGNKIYSAELFSKYLVLNPTSPSHLSWKIDRYTGRGKGRLAFKAGTSAGSLNTLGYWEIRLEGQLYLGHRVVYCLKNSTDLGESCQVIDHVNNNRSDNNPDNLRLVSQQTNARNSLVRSDSRTGIVGVTLKPKQHCWRASVRDSSGVAIEKLFYFSSPLRKKNWDNSYEYLDYNSAFFSALKWRTDKMLELGYPNSIMNHNQPPITYEQYLEME